jgi:hypothetical protein
MIDKISLDQRSQKFQLKVKKAYFEEEKKYMNRDFFCFVLFHLKAN